MPVSGISLLDANVWLALAVSTHQHHVSATAWFDRQSDNSCAFCRITQMALLRHLTNSKIMNGDVQNQADAWHTYEKLLSDGRVVFCPEPEKAESYWKEWTNEVSPSHKTWTDRYMAAFAMAGGLQLVTFDRGFKSLIPTQLMMAENANFNLSLIQ
jgi:toxin-antitoxin system PIN domain toxin